MHNCHPHKVHLSDPQTITEDSENRITNAGHSHKIEKASQSTAGIVKVVDHTESTEPLEALSANQGRILAEALQQVAHYNNDETINQSLDAALGYLSSRLTASYSTLALAEANAYKHAEASLIYVVNDAEVSNCGLYTIQGGQLVKAPWDALSSALTSEPFEVLHQIMTLPADATVEYQGNVYFSLATLGKAITDGQTEISEIIQTFITANGLLARYILTDSGKTQEEVNTEHTISLEDAVNELGLKAPQATTYTKIEVDSALALKATQSNTYTKAEVDTTFAAYVGGRKAYTTLALAQADQANLPADTAIEVTNDPTSGNNGTYQWDGTTLTKSAYDPLTQAKSYTDTAKSEAIATADDDATAKAKAAEANANLRTGITFDFYSSFNETQFFEADKNLKIIRKIEKGGVDSAVVEAKDYADQKSKDVIKEVGIITDFYSYFDSTQFVEVDKEFRIVREIKKGYMPDGSGGIVLDFYSNFKEKSSALVVISNNNKVLLKMASDGSEIFNANNLKNNVAVDATHIEHTFLKKRLAEHPIAAKFNYHRSNDGTVANFPSLIQVYEMYDELMSRHSDSMTKITLGTDATGLPIYCYIIKPKPYLAVGFSEEALKHPKVVISGAIHGNERPAQVGCAVFTAQLLDEHMKRERYATLRHACEFHIIPAINPWGASNFSRTNSNSVDLNRDFGDGLFAQAESQLMRDYVLSLDDVMLFVDMHQSQSPDYLLWLGATRPKSRELTKAFAVESLKYFYANVRSQVTTQYSFQIAVNGDDTMCQYFSNQGIESILIESPVSHEAIGDATVVRDFVTETYAIAINEFYQNFKQTNANTAI